ncbi:expressed unknown protein [Ectocarpus siliculosus]|uniref:Uncharacterized protein n=1 Tax=Ectocarpus siliculosus TaxID=2880 RepID=D7FN36_ECTSI|nr:expressed unknown protein [Ectocarpus siliculosus]|eukprot:CBJ30100.1 expressed unknown protein [Ectocarpus siliculosus]
MFLLSEPALLHVGGDWSYNMHGLVDCIWWECEKYARTSTVPWLLSAGMTVS